MSYFTYQAISHLLANLNSEFGVFALRDWRGQSGIILRHDVDLDIEPAYRLSRYELDMGIKGSYFFLVTAPTYNCQAINNRTMLRTMAEDGCEIALHFDPTIYPEVDEVALDAVARREAVILEDIIGQRVNSVSLHNPSITNRYPMLPGWNNAYDANIFDESVYLSDSRMQFRHDPALFFTDAKTRVHQLLIHPMHYAKTTPHYPVAKLAYIKRLVETLHEAFKVNTTYQRDVGDRLVELLAEDVQNWDQLK